MDSEHGNKTNHNSEAHARVVDRSGSSKHSRTHSEARMASESGNSTNHSESQRNENGSHDFIEVHTRRSSSSSSSPSTSSKDLLEAKTLKDENAQPSSSVGPSMSPTESPPVQVMDRSGGYDPNRIPSSIFERNNPTTPAEWSCASNESLFSIHIGHNSFSVYGDPTKNDDLFKSGELLACSPSPPLPPSSVESTAKTGEKRGEESEAKVEKRNEGKPAQPGVSWKSPTINEAKPGHPAAPWKSSSNSNHSDRSMNSTHSFSFPILAEGVASEPGKPEAEEQKMQQAPEANQNPSPKSWFSCFSWCPCCSSCTRSCSGS